MREIKFRIWDKKHKRWFQGSTDQKSIALQTDAIDLFGEVIIFGEILHDQNEDDVWKNDPDIKGSLDVMNWLEVCQYTGLRDKNGIPIYEGDILSIPARKDKSNGKLYKVEWHRVHARFNFANKNGEFGEINIGKIKRAEVIGNIHENPELLGEE
jgi:uncharacterized phage protein (TIGR01671 family)